MIIIAHVIDGALQLQRLPPALHAGYVHAYAAALQPVFFFAGCIGVIAFALAWLIPEVALKQTAGATDPGETFAMPSDRSSAQEIERALAVLANREDRIRTYRRFAKAAGVALEPFACWMLIRLGHAGPVAISHLAQRLGASPQRLQPALDELAAKGYIDWKSKTVRLTAAGDGAYARLVELRSEGLRKLLRGWPPEQQLEMTDTLRALAEKFLSCDFDDIFSASMTRMQAAARTP